MTGLRSEAKLSARAKIFALLNTLWLQSKSLSASSAA